MTVRAYNDWPTNGHLIADVAKLGWLRDDDRVLDVTYGMGVFWKVWQPKTLIGCDIDPDKSPFGRSVDFTALPWNLPMFDAVVFDPPYKLNGTPDEAVDARYGVAETSTWQDRMELIRAGCVECARVSKDRLLVKCQDQVSSGRVRWQTDLVTDTVLGLGGWRKADRFDMTGTSRPQPGDRKQKHAHGRPSTLLVFQREGK